MSHSETYASIKKAVNRSMYGHPFITDMTLENEEQNSYVAIFQLVREIDDVLLRRFGEELYKRLKEEGYIINVSLKRQSSKQVLFILEYTGKKVK